MSRMRAVMNEYMDGDEMYIMEASYWSPRTVYFPPSQLNFIMRLWREECERHREFAPFRLRKELA